MGKYWGSIVGVGSVILYDNLTGSYLTVLILIIPYVLGIWFATSYVKKEHINKGLVESIAWSNLVTWLIPFICLFTIGATQQFNTYNTKDREKYQVIIWVAFILTFINSVWGAKRHTGL